VLAFSLGIQLSPEWLRTIATVLPVLLGAWWLWVLQASLWRRWVWDEAGDGVRAVAEQLGGEIRPLWTGWRVRADAARVDWVAGLSLRTRVRGDGRVVRRAGLLGADEVLATLRR